MIGAAVCGGLKTEGRMRCAPAAITFVLESTAYSVFANGH